MQSARAIFSCNSCRQRKLKCDRNDPCSSCVARNVECVYASHPRLQSVPKKDTGQHLDARIRRLEQLIRTIDAQKAPNPDSDCQNCGKLGSDVQIGHPIPADLLDERPKIKPGRMISNKTQTAYVCGVHWAAIYNEVASIREELNEEDTSTDLNAFESSYANGPMLLGGLRPLTDLEDIRSAIPPKDVADRLVSRYFNSSDPSNVMIHAPTFGQEYNRFWLDQENVSTPWLAQLFGILGVGTFLHLRSGDHLPGALANPTVLIDTFQRHSTECLIISNYSTAPEAYTIEALLLNLQLEYLRHRDAHLGVWALGGVAIRLAMRMGYHRDSSGYSQISVFQGEMRRRVWVLMLQLDILTSCQLGLPSMIQEHQYDTRLPHNLLDEDFGLDSIQLPPERSNTEFTPILYSVNKARLLIVFRAIFNRVSLERTEEYNEIMDLDQRLNRAHQSISPRFRMDDAGDFITLPAYILMRRYNIELLFQNSRCILHRHHMAKSFRDSRYNFSRIACVDAAMATLTHQANILKEVQVGGLLYRDQWFVTSLEQNDFLLASMIVCLELSSRIQDQAPAPLLEAAPEVRFSDADLVTSLKSSCHFWDELKAKSTEARQAFDTVTAMLNAISNAGTLQSGHAAAARLFADGDGGIDMDVQGYIDDPYSSYSGGPAEELLHAFNPTPEGIENFFNGPDIVDWDHWESFVKPSRSSM